MVAAVAALVVTHPVARSDRIRVRTDLGRVPVHYPDSRKEIQTPIVQPAQEEAYPHSVVKRSLVVDPGRSLVVGSQESDPTVRDLQGYYLFRATKADFAHGMAVKESCQNCFCLTEAQCLRHRGAH